MSAPLLEVEDLQVRMTAGQRTIHAVRGVSYRIEPGEVLALVGESGCGKTVSGLALLKLISGVPVEVAGSARLDGRNLLDLSAQQLRRIRGRQVGVIFQDPLSALHPSLSIGAQLSEAIRAHDRADRAAVRRRAIELLERMRLPHPARRLSSYPHELSGGQRQRVMIAIALAGSPKLVIADEPTTALDVTVQREILSLLRELRDAEQLSILLISHDLGVVGELADRVAVMYAGRIVEHGSVEAVLARPGHPYTQGLMRARPRLSPDRRTLPLGLPGKPPPLTADIPGCAFAPRCPVSQPDHRLHQPVLMSEEAESHQVACLLAADQRVEVWPVAVQHAFDDAKSRMRDLGLGPVISVRGLVKRYPGRGRRTAAASELAVDHVDLDIAPGETLAVVGSSGCGKSTLARILLGLEVPTAGEVRLGARPLEKVKTAERAQVVQLVFQDPFASLNPRRAVGESIADPIRDLPRAERRQRVGRLLDQVGLDPGLALRSPTALSGGERQRVALARALAPAPALLVADEPVTALDVSVQAQVLALLAQIQREMDLAILLIAHDLAVVAALAHRIAVMDNGRIVEIGSTGQLIREPRHATTRVLLDAVPQASRVGGV